MRKEEVQGLKQAIFSDSPPDVFKIRPNMSKSDRAERGIIINGSGKITFPSARRS